MRESHGLETGVRPPNRHAAVPTLMPARSSRPGVSLAARTMGSASLRSSPTPAAASATLQRMVSAVDMRIVTLMNLAESSEQRSEARLELALLAHLHRTLVSQSTHLAGDVVLCDSVVEFADAVAQILADLESGGVRRLRRLLEHNSHLLAELVMVGGPAAQIKPDMQKARALVARDDVADLEPAARQALLLFARLSAELERRCPRQRGTWLDDVTKP